MGKFPDENLIKNILATIGATVLADESTDDAKRSQMALYVRCVDAGTNFPVEKFMEMVKLTTSKKDIDLYEILINVFSAKGIELSKVIRFSGLDRTNAMSGDRKGVQILIVYQLLKPKAYKNNQTCCYALVHAWRSMR